MSSIENVAAAASSVADDIARARLDDAWATAVLVGYIRSALDGHSIH